MSVGTRIFGGVGVDDGKGVTASVNGTDVFVAVLVLTGASVAGIGVFVDDSAVFVISNVFVGNKVGVSGYDVGVSVGTRIAA